jgi:hypothetical protein
MSNGNSWRSVRFVAIGALVLGITSCAGSQETASTLASAAASASKTSPQASGIEVNTGFFSDPNGFAFANWKKTGSLKKESLITLFGSQSVCIDSNVSDCQLLPSAAQWLDQVNLALTSGRCEGMAILSQQFFQNIALIKNFNESAPFTFALNENNEDLQRSIEELWATQLLPTALEAAAESRRSGPGAIAEILRSALTQGTVYTMGLYDETGAGHTVTPTSIVAVQSGWEISLYDNNVPGVQQTLNLSNVDNTWSYQPVDSSGTSIGDAIGGGAGTLDITPLEVRSLPQTPPFSTHFNSDGATKGVKQAHVLVTSSQRTSKMLVSVALEGKSTRTRQLMSDSNAPVIYTPLRVGDPAASGFTAQWNVGEVDRVEFGIGHQPGTTSSGESVVASLDVPGVPRLLAELDGNQGGSLQIGASAEQGVSLQSLGGAATHFTVSNGLVTIRFFVGANVTVTAKPVSQNGTSLITLADPKGDSGTVEFSIPTSLTPGSADQIDVDATDLSQSFKILKSSLKSSTLKKFLSTSGLGTYLEKGSTPDQSQPSNQEPGNTIQPDANVPTSKPTSQPTSKPTKKPAAEQAEQDEQEEPVDPAEPVESAEPLENFPTG